MKAFSMYPDKDRAAASRSTNGKGIQDPDCPLISIITAVRNGEDHLERTILSVLEQNYKHIEYIIIDGASTDGTREIIRKYENRIACLISEPDEGIYDAMNKGIERATGKWINFMNSGDVFYDQETVLKIFSLCAHQNDVLYGDHVIRYGAEHKKLCRAGAVKHLWKGMIFCHQSSFIKTGLMKQYKFDTKNRISADFDFFYFLYIRGCNFFNTNLVISSVLADGVSGIDTLATFRSQWAVVEKYGPDRRIRLMHAVLLMNRYLKNLVRAFLPQSIETYLRAKL